jgi:hypothetical protein
LHTPARNFHNPQTAICQNAGSENLTINMKNYKPKRITSECSMLKMTVAEEIFFLETTTNDNNPDNRFKKTQSEGYKFNHPYLNEHSVTFYFPESPVNAIL